MSVPRISLVVEIEGTPEIKVEASGADLDALVEWLASAAVRERLDALVALATSRDTSA